MSKIYEGWVKMTIGLYYYPLRTYNEAGFTVFLGCSRLRLYAHPENIVQAVCENIQNLHPFTPNTWAWFTELTGVEPPPIELYNEMIKNNKES